MNNAQKFADVLTASLADLDWKPRRSHLEAARNGLLSAAQLIAVLETGNDAICKKNDELMTLTRALTMELIAAKPLYSRRQLMAEIDRLMPIQLAAARFRSAVVGSGALNHVSQDKYMDELRALEQALAATASLTSPVDGAAS